MWLENVDVLLRLGKNKAVEEWKIKILGIGFI
jgi:hypothetical protein